jgi:large subunit ribosomal protein L23
MKLEPVITEKSTLLTKERKYTFRVDKGATKSEIRNAVNKTFGVTVLGVRTVKEKGEVKKGLSGRKRVVKPGKKAIVTLPEKQKIDVFETKKK